MTICRNARAGRARLRPFAQSKKSHPEQGGDLSAAVRCGLERGVRDCYIDCVPTLLAYYKALGFTVAGREFFHRENGPSTPMVLDVAGHGDRLGMDGGARDYLKVFARAEVSRLAGRTRERPPRERTVE